MCTSNTTEQNYFCISIDVVCSAVVCILFSSNKLNQKYVQLLFNIQTFVVIICCKSHISVIGIITNCMNFKHFWTCSIQFLIAKRYTYLILIRKRIHYFIFLFLLIRINYRIGGACYPI